jgi:hypothetical protein
MKRLAVLMPCNVVIQCNLGNNVLQIAFLFNVVIPANQADVWEPHLPRVASSGSFLPPTPQRGAASPSRVPGQVPSALGGGEGGGLEQRPGHRAFVVQRRLRVCTCRWVGR